MCEWTNVVEALGQIGEVLVLIGALYYASMQLRKSQDRHNLEREQLRKSQEQHDLGREQLNLDQLIAWKNSALGLNRLAMQYPDIFKEVLYPRAGGPKEVKNMTAAYSSLHALEVMYYMREKEEQSSDRLEVFLRAYVDSPELRAAWKKDGAQTAFTRKFQQRLNEVIDKYPLSNTSSQLSNTSSQ